MGTTVDIGKLVHSSSLVQEQRLIQTFVVKLPKVVVIAGPTCSGKSALALLLAEKIGGEIISADSIQVYRGLDIGTAKPTEAEMKCVPHHLVDVVDLQDAFNVVDFFYAASHTIQLILDRGAVPIVVGGTGFYLHALFYGPPSGPPSVPEVRAKLEEEWVKLGGALLYERLSQLDLDYAKTITCHDRQKIIRALEIIEVSGMKVSQHSWRERRLPKQFDFRCFYLNRPTAQLYERIEKRCDKMLEKGLLDEVARLEKVGLRNNLSASQAIGYRQALEFLSGPQKREDYLAFLERFKQHSRRYAKRQKTWFKRESLFEWLDLDLIDPEAVIEIIEREIE